MEIDEKKEVENKNKIIAVLSEVIMSAQKMRYDVYADTETKIVFDETTGRLELTTLKNGEFHIHLDLYSDNWRTFK